MKLVWNPELAVNAYLDTVKSQSGKLYQESGVSELISAMAAGWNAKLIVETWSKDGPITTSIGLAMASNQTNGRHICIVPDESSRSEYLRLMSEVSSNLTAQVIVGDPEEVMGIPSLQGIDFMVVDSRRKDFASVLRLARLSSKGAVLICKNASSKDVSTFRWRSVIDGDCYRVVKTAALPVGKGLDIAHVAVNGGDSDAEKQNGKGKRKWIKHVDRNSGEEFVFRT